MEERELDGVKLWHIVAVLLFCLACTLVRAAEPPNPTKQHQLPKTEAELKEEPWNRPATQPPLTDEEVEGLIRYLGDTTK